MACCPVCQRPIPMAKTSSANRPQFYPFCSDRCKWVDLGAWLDEDYVIVAGSDSDEPQISEQEQDDEES